MPVLGPAGGTGGEPFNDEGNITNPAVVFVTEIRVWAGSLVDAVQMVLNTGPLPKHGGGGGTLSAVQMNPGERITKIYGRNGSEVDHIHIVTDQRGEILSAGGGGGSNNYVFEAPPGTRIIGFFGRSGKPDGGQGVHVDAIGVVV